MRHVISIVLLSFLFVSVVHAEDQQSTQSERVMFVLDASGSMWGQIQGGSKIEVARSAFKELVKDWSPTRQAGLVVYGHRSKGDCKDIETVIPLGPLSKSTMVSTVDGISPKGMTPLSAAVLQAAENLKYTEQAATVILISDGKETCEMDPCALGQKLEGLGVDFTAHVIGFDVKNVEDQKGLKCLAENTGGQFILANNSQELNNALKKTVVEPKPKPEPVAKGELVVPAQALKGTLVQVTPKADTDIDGYVSLYLKGRQKSLAYGYVTKDENGNYKPVSLRVPGVVGQYEIKWTTKHKQLVATADIELIDAKISLTAPDTATKGTQINVQLNAPEGLDGYIYLYAKGQDKHISYDYVRLDQTKKAYEVAKLRLPSTPGPYVIKWVTRKNEPLAETELTVVDAEVSLSAAETVAMGTKLIVTLSAPKGLDGYIYLYPQGKDKHVSYDYVIAGDKENYRKAKLSVPAALGPYTIKWVTKKHEVIASKTVEVVGAAIAMKAPETVPMGTHVDVDLVGPEGLDGYIYLYLKGREKHITYGYVIPENMGGYKTVKLTVPARVGEYELKWISKRKDVLSETTFKVEQANFSLSATDEAAVGSKLTVKLVGPAGSNGYIHLFKKGTDQSVTYGYVRDGALDPYEPAYINLPKEEGDYILKWVTKDKEVLAERPITVVSK